MPADARYWLSFLMSCLAQTIAVVRVVEDTFDVVPQNAQERGVCRQPWLAALSLETGVLTSSW
jgi:uncharacterized membrane protein YiaA